MNPRSPTCWKKPGSSGPARRPPRASARKPSPRPQTERGLEEVSSLAEKQNVEQGSLLVCSRPLEEVQDSSWFVCPSEAYGPCPQRNRSPRDSSALKMSIDGCCRRRRNSRERSARSAPRGSFHLRWSVAPVNNSNEEA